MKKSIFGISMLTLTCLYGLLAAVIILITTLVGGQVLVGIGISLVILIIQFLIAPFITDLSMKFFYKASFAEEIPDYLKRFIEEECKKHNMKYPKIGLIHDGAPNAFTYGRTKNDARIILTDGIFNLLNEDEVKAVVAHEMGHIIHYDMLFMTAVQVVPLVLYAIFEMFTRSDSDDDNKAAYIGWIAYVLYLISQYIILYLSRTREYFADDFSITETKNPKALGDALVKIGFGLSTASRENTKHDVSKNNALGIFDAKESKAMVVSCLDDGEVAKEKIKNAMKWEKWNPWALWYEFNSTHPLISKRLEAIAKRSQEFNQEPYIIFDLPKEESYVGNFISEVILSFTPMIILVVGVVLGLILYNEKFKLTLFIGILGLLFTLASYLKFMRAHKNSDYKETNVAELLSEVKVSHITSIPCTLSGQIIGRGNPGCIFNEDFVIKDETGIIFLDYNQPLNLLNKIFALFKSSEYFDKKIKVKGWYRRSPVPYVEIKEYEVDGVTKKISTFMVYRVFYFILMLASIILLFV